MVAAETGPLVDSPCGDEDRGAGEPEGTAPPGGPGVHPAADPPPWRRGAACGAGRRGAPAGGGLPPPVTGRVRRTPGAPRRSAERPADGHRPPTSPWPPT